jgi:hypothetical protein
MPYRIKRVGTKYKVVSPHGIRARGTTKGKAEKQVRLLRGLKHGFIPDKLKR